MKKIIISLVVVLAVAAGATGLVLVKNKEPEQPQQSQQSTQSQQEAQEEQATESEISYKGVEGQNALELLKQSHEVETESYEGIGEMVTSIDGTASDSTHFWSLYVNGQQSQVGASAYTTKDTDTIEWKLEEIK